MVMALDSELNGCELDFQPRHCWVTSNNLRQVVDTHVPLSPSSINWYGCKSRGINRSTTRCTNPTSVVSQYQLVSGWHLWKRRSASPYGPMWLGRTLHLFTLQTQRQLRVAEAVTWVTAVDWCSELVALTDTGSITLMWSLWAESAPSPPTIAVTAAVSTQSHHAICTCHAHDALVALHVQTQQLRIFPRLSRTMMYLSHGWSS